MPNLIYRWFIQNTVKGFTLIELLITISILTILAVVGVTVYSGVTTKARDSAKKADIQAIAKAYEVKYSSTGSYQTLADTDFASGKPSTMASSSFSCIYGPDSTCTTVGTDKFAVCVNLNNDNTKCYSPSSSCICHSSTQGIPFTSLSGGGNPSCDPYGSVGSTGLVGYWKMDEASWNNNCSTASVIDSSISNYHSRSCPVAVGPLGGVTGKLGNAGQFDGVDDYVDVPNTAIIPSITITGWLYYNQAPPSRYLSIITNWWGTFGKIYIGADGRVYWRWLESDSTTWRQLNSSVVSIGSWHFFAATFDKATGTAKLYLDSITPVHTITAINIERPSGNNIIIGHDQATLSGNNEGLPFNGRLDDIHIFNYALSDSKISTLYNNGSGCAAP